MKEIKTVFTCNWKVLTFNWDVSQIFYFSISFDIILFPWYKGNNLILSETDLIINDFSSGTDNYMAHYNIYLIMYGQTEK
jgi:hypothetical protein